ncbi:MAG: cupin domain-containing protein [Actinobacteria bacterium]|nr:cupin domain-containing protein [Actinomycetota bacterium]
MQPDTPVVVDLLALAEVAEGGIVSKPVVENEHHKLVHFTFAPGQELSEHTASVPAAIHVLRGRATIKLGEQTYEAHAGSFFYMPAYLKHAVHAEEELVFLLTMFRT